MSGNIIAPEGQVWVCCACGKTSQDKYGDKMISRGWDASCMLNSVLAKKKHLVYDGSNKRVIRIEEDGIVEDS